MRERGLRPPSAAMVVALLALFVALGGVGAVASGVLTTTKVTRIAKKQAKKQVLRLAPQLSVARAKNADNATNADNANAVGGAGLGSLTVGRSSNGSGGCDLDANSSTFTNCGSVDLTLPRSGRVLLNMVGTWRDTSGGAATEGACRLALDGAAASSTETRYGQDGQVFDTRERRASLAINFVTDPLGAGPHTFTLQCDDPVGTVSFADDQLSAVMIGTD
jgi:hypothetical protein